MSGPEEPGQPPRLLVSRAGPAVVLRLNRPSVRNAIDDALQAELIREVERVAADGDVRALVLTGEGTAFCAGGDVSGMKTRLERPPGQVAVASTRRLRQTQRMVSSLHDVDVVTIAAVNGPALGVGLDLALCCDLVVASADAFFATGYIQRGLVPDGGGLYYLPRRVGLARAKELVFSGRRVPADEALAIGLADRVVPAAELEEAALALASQFTQGSKPATAFAKAILNRTFESTREEVYARSIDAQAVCYTTDEHRDSVAAFMTKPSAPPGTSDA